ARLVRLDAQFAMSVVARTTGLANVLTFRLRRLANGFTERNLGLADVGFNLVLALHAVDKNLEMQLAHAADDGLARIFVGPHLEGGILISQPRQGNAHLLLVGLGLRYDSHRDDRLREGDGAKSNRMLRRRQRVSR